MKVRRQEGGSALVVFEEIEPLFLHLLRTLPASADPEDDLAAGERLFSAPMAAQEEEFNEDWREYVQPELADLFRSAREIVVGDLSALPADDAGEDLESKTAGQFDSADFEPTGHSLEVPARHAEAWLSVLNQARLVIAAKHGIGEKEMDRESPFPPFVKGEYALFQIHFYAELQEILLRAMGLA
jgi:hypothetical protein